MPILHTVPDEAPHAAPKQYLQINVVRLVDRDTEAGEQVWRDLIDHHCFRGNDTMMVFERFYSERRSLAEIEAERQPGDPTTVELFFTRWLEGHGYRYGADGYLIHPASGTAYHGLLLDIAW